MSQANLKIALVISFLFTGLGIAYAGNIQKGLTLLGGAILCNIFGFIIHPIFSYLSIAIWAYGLYGTYIECTR